MQWTISRIVTAGTTPRRRYRCNVRADGSCVAFANVLSPKPRRVRNAGCFRLHSGQQFLSQALNGETIGLEQIDHALWNILYYDTLLGRYDEHKRRITGVPALRGKC